MCLFVHARTAYFLCKSLKIIEETINQSTIRDLLTSNMILYIYVYIYIYFSESANYDRPSPLISARHLYHHQRSLWITFLFFFKAYYFECYTDQQRDRRDFSINLNFIQNDRFSSMNEHIDQVICSRQLNLSDLMLREFVQYSIYNNRNKVTYGVYDCVHVGACLFVCVVWNGIAL